MTKTKKQAMEFEKKENESARKSIEAEFTELDTLLAANPVDQDVIIHQLEFLDSEIATYLNRLDVYKELLVRNNLVAEYDQEVATANTIKKRRHKAAVIIGTLCSKSPGASSGGTMDSTAYRVHLPKREIPKFGGDVRQWKSFWASFKEVDADKSIPAIEKYNYLLQHMVPGTSAAKVVSSFPPADTSYKLAKDELEHRFGREKTLIKVYVRDLLTLVVDNAKEKKTSNFVDVVTTLQSQILNLEQLGVTPDKYGVLLYPIIESCVPVDVLNRYLDMPGSKEEMEDILNFLRNEVRRREESARAQSAFAQPGKTDRPLAKDRSADRNNSPTAINFLNAEEKKACGFCGFNHPTTECRKTKGMTVTARKDALRKSFCCFKCLQTGHISKKCKSKAVCSRCGGHHHQLICEKEEVPEKRVDQVNLHPPPSSSQSPATKVATSWTYGPGPSRVSNENRTDMANYIRKPDVLMQTLLVRVYSPNGASRVVRALHDSGSQSSYVKESLAKQLELKQEGKELVVHQTFGAKLSEEMEHPVVRIEISGLAEPYLHHYTFQTSVVKEIVENVVTVPRGPWIDECAAKGIPLTDVGPVEKVEILIGGDVAPYLNVGMRSLQLTSGLIARETRIGCYLEGRVPGTGNCTTSKAMTCLNMFLGEKDVEQFWALETIGIRDASENRTREELEQAALNHFNKTVRQDKSGRFEVHLPWIEGHPSLPDNRGQVFRRLEKTTTDLIKNGYLQQYDDVLKDWNRRGIIEKVPHNAETSGVLHYLGHRAIIKEGSTTPVRPVFNASAKTKVNPSLNECLEKGPNLLDIIPTILSRFRLGKIGVIADIEKAFLQLSVTPDHRDCLRFLWWEDIAEKKKVAEYRHCRVVFGVSSSPFLLGAVIQRLLSESKAMYPMSVGIMEESFYVDNLVASLNILQEVINLRKEATEIFNSAQMNLRDWQYGPSSEQKTVSVLGHLWDIGQDSLGFDTKKILQVLSTVTIHTRRTVLSLANSCFDPLGVLSPIVIVIKILFKRICADDRKFSWDAPLPAEFQNEVNKWAGQLSTVGTIAIPRCITDGRNSREGWTLHVMSDASKEAYACCVYLRVEGDPANVQLIQARARVMPMKVLTIPRAELLGCFIAAKLYTQVVKDLSLTGLPVYLYTDSSTALTWIKRVDAVWGVFVNRRVEDIRRLTDVNDWHHIRGELNPADLPSRGTSGDKYIRLRWWEGPDWLKASLTDIPITDFTADEQEVNLEKRKTVVSAIVQEQPVSFIDGITSLQVWEKIVRVVASSSRFVGFVKKPSTLTPSTPLSFEEIQMAEKTVIRHIQRSISLEKCRKLRPFMDTDGLFHVKTRLVSEDKDFQRPILLPGNNELVHLLIRKEHLKACHAGVQYLASILREKYWITKCKRSIRAAIKDCFVCKLQTARRCQVEEAPLPADRTNVTKCFTVTGVDLAGPLILKDGQKVWIVLFTCAVYRAVHLELVTSLTTDAFLVALRKFVVRKGRPSTIYSDNGTNFRGCHNLFSTLDWKHVQEYAAVERLQWIFNPPTAAWWGGWWERLIGMTKQLVRRNLGARSVEFAELELLLLEVEAVLNERPLTYVSEDSNDFRPLTPSMFMRDLPTSYLPELDVSAGQLRRSYRHVQKLKEQLRTRFRKEYLAELVHHGKAVRSDKLNSGDIVLVEVENKKRIEWPLGIILEVYPGRDGICRTARIRTTQGEIVRPFQRLFPLEVTDKMVPLRDAPPGKSTSDTVDSYEDSEQEEEPIEISMEELEPIVVTRYGRKSKKPQRL